MIYIHTSFVKVVPNHYDVCYTQHCTPSTDILRAWCFLRISHGDSVLLGENPSIKLNATVVGSTWIFLQLDASDSAENIYSLEWKRSTIECSDGTVNEPVGVSSKVQDYNITNLEEGSRYSISASVSNNEGTTSTLSITETTLTTGNFKYYGSNLI